MQYFLSFHRKIDNKFDEELDDSTIFKNGSFRFFEIVIKYTRKVKINRVTGDLCTVKRVIASTSRGNYIKRKCNTCMNNWTGNRRYTVELSSSLHNTVNFHRGIVL